MTMETPNGERIEIRNVCPSEEQIRREREEELKQYLDFVRLLAKKD